MPYLENQRRIDLRELITKLEQAIAYFNFVPGDVNYIITKLCHAYIETKGECYQHYNDLIGALESAKLELYRKRVANYEEKKEEENGGLD